jgi:integrase/recombinase XerD
MNTPNSSDQHRQSFLESMRLQRRAEATIKHRIKVLSRFYAFMEQRGLGDVREVTRHTVRDYQSWLLEQSCSAFTVHAYTICLRRFFEHLEAVDTILLNPCVGVPLPTLPNRLPRAVLTPDEARLVLDAPNSQTLKGTRDKAILEMFYSTGIRCEEMAQLTIHDVDHRNGFLRVNKGKFAKDRVVPIGSNACNCVCEYLEKVRSKWSKVNQDERALWLSTIRPHGPLKKQMVAVMVSDYGRAVGLKKPLSPHVWRHTCATHLVSNGSDIAYVQRLLGHRSLETTQRYTRVAVPEVCLTFKKKHPRARLGTAPAAQAGTRTRANHIPLREPNPL